MYTITLEVAMKKKHIVILSIIFLILILVGYFVYTQWNNISAVIDSFRYSQEEVASKLEENQEEIKQYLKEKENIVVRDLTKEEAQALNEGKLTEEEAIKLLTGENETIYSSGNNDEKNILDKKENSNKDNVVQNNGNKEPNNNGTGKIVADSIAKLYIQKNNYLSKLEGIEAAALEEFSSIDKPYEERGPEKKAIISRYMGMVAAWEKECDSIVYGLLDEVKQALKENGQDESIARTIEQSYLNEKKLKKTYYINRYMD